MPTIGYNVVGSSNSATASNSNVQGFSTTSGFTYTAVSGDTVTEFAVYASSDGDVAVSVYTVSGGVPATRVNSPVTITVGSSAGWYTASASVALTAGVEYTICWDYYLTAACNTYYHLSGAGGNPGGNQVSTDTAAVFVLPATWTHASYGAARHSFYATVTGAAADADVDAGVVDVTVSVDAPTVTVPTVAAATMFLGPTRSTTVLR